MPHGLLRRVLRFRSRGNRRTRLRLRGVLDHSAVPAVEVLTTTRQGVPVHALIRTALATEALRRRGRDRRSPIEVLPWQSVFASLSPTAEGPAGWVLTLCLRASV